MTQRDCTRNLFYSERIALLRAPANRSICETIIFFVSRKRASSGINILYIIAEHFVSRVLLSGRQQCAYPEQCLRLGVVSANNGKYEKKKNKQKINKKLPRTRCRVVLGRPRIIGRDRETRRVVNSVDERTNAWFRNNYTFDEIDRFSIVQSDDG